MASSDTEGVITGYDGLIKDSARGTGLVEAKVHGALVEHATVCRVPVVTISSVPTEAVSISPKVWNVRGLCSCCCHVLCSMRMRRLWRIGRHWSTCCCLMRNLLRIAPDVVWPVTEFGCVIEQESGGARDLETLGTSTDKVLCAGVRISIETTSFADTIKSVGRSNVMSSFYG